LTIAKQKKDKEQRLINGFTPRTWIRLDTKHSYSQVVQWTKMPKKERKRPEQKIVNQGGETTVISRLLVSLNHPHPSDVNKMYVEMDRKSRMVRSKLSLEEFTRILSRAPSCRTVLELQGADDYLRQLTEFQSKPDYIIANLCHSLTAKEYKLGDPIFRQGEPGYRWYVILQGTVKITVTKPGWSILDPQAPQNFIATLKSGEKFGDHALLNDLNRSATAWADSTHTILIGLDKFDFLRLIGQAHQIEQKDRVFFLKKIPMLSKLDLQSLRNIADRLVMREIPPNTVLQKEGEMTDTVFFLKSGTCDVYKELTKKKKILLGHLRPNSSFNENSAFSSGTARKGAPFTVVTSFDQVVVATIASNGEWLNFNLTRTRSIFEEMSNDELLRRFKVSISTKKFRNYQQKYLNALKKEKSKVS
jgi:CRP-like cAMP-binding protein